MEDRISIFCATDENYASVCGIMVSSLIANNTGVDVYILVENPLHKSHRKKFERLNGCNDSKIIFVQLDRGISYTDFPLPFHNSLTMATYYRLFATEVLPKSIDKVLYLDCDIIINGDIHPLWNMDISGYSAGVIGDILAFDKSLHRKLDIPDEVPYFNAGVMLINLDYWRKNELLSKFYDNCKKYWSKLYYFDQDILNVTLSGFVKYLSLGFNFQVFGLQENCFNNFDSAKQSEYLNVDPVIIHYVGPYRPWKIDGYYIPFRRLWFQYKKASLWRWTVMELFPKKKLKKAIKLLIKRYFLWPLNICMPDYYYRAEKSLVHKH